MLKLKPTKKLKGTLFASLKPTIIGQPKQKPKQKKNLKVPEPTERDKRVMEKIAKNSKLAAKRGEGALKNPRKSTPERDREIERAFNEYMHKMHLPMWGNTSLDADDKGFDGHADLKLEKFLTNESGIPIKRFISHLMNADEKQTNLLCKATAFNAWEWANFGNRLWANTLNEQPPIRRVVGIELHKLIPCVNHDGMLDKLIASLGKDHDVKQAFASLGFCKTKVRLLPILQTPTKPATMYKLYDLLQWQKGNSYNIRGLVVYADKQVIEELPRDICVVQLSNQRKSALKQLDTAVGTGHKVIIPFSVLKGDLSSIQEVKASKTYQKLVKTWAGLTPLISMPIDTKMGLVGKVSKLGDILLT